MFDGFFSGPAWVLAQFYALTHSYALSIALLTVIVMAIITPLTLKSTKSMLEMQKVQPQMKRLQQQYKNDKQKLNEEMMKLYSEHKVNPLASCLPLVAQMPVFILMFRLIRGLTQAASASDVTKLAAEGITVKVGHFAPQYVSKTSELYISLVNKTEMTSLGLDLSKSPKEVMLDSFGRGIIYAALVVFLAALYWLQQRQIASRTVNPSMSAGQQKLMQYMPVAFAGFQLFFPTGLVFYYITQTLLRIVQQSYITKRFYGHDESLGRQAQRAGEEARSLHKADKDAKGGGGASAKTNAKPTPKAAAKPTPKAKPLPKNAPARPAPQGKPKAKPTTSGTGSNSPTNQTRPATTTGKGRPTASRHPKPNKKK